MHTTQGYTIAETLLDDGNYVLLRASREGQPVLVRKTASDYPSPEQLGRMRYGYDLSRSLPDVAVARPIGLEKHGNSLWLVMEDFGGRPLHSVLASDPLSVKEALEIALGLSRALGELHRNHVIHQGIEPANILVDRERGQVRLCNLDIASRVSRQSPMATNIERLEGTLAYLSPEQTGRMNRVVDFRTDLYSLGVTFYEMLTGKVPFQGTDPLAVVHGHIALQPVPPHQLRPEVPLAVSQIVLRLMAKNAEDRYQSTYGLGADLRECLDRLQASGTLESFTPGRHDVSTAFQLPQKLYGREQETAALMAAFERASQGRTELVLVSGYSGIGKSSLVNEIHKPVVAHRGYFLSGKFDQLQNVPYRGVIQAFHAMVHHILSQSEEQIVAWRARIQQALGASAQVIVDVLPELTLILGQQPPVPVLGPTEAQSCLNLAFQQFIGVFTSQEHPVALFLDDLQWADTGTLSLLQLLLRDPNSRHLLFIGAYRDNEVHDAHPLMLMLDELRKSQGGSLSELVLRPLQSEDLSRLVADTFQCALQDARALAALGLSKTQGNPFFINQFLTSLNDRGLVVFDPEKGRWTWSLERIEQVGITQDVAELMAERIRQLSLATQRVLNIAACIGHSFDLRMLALVNQSTPEQAANELWSAVELGLVLPLGNSYKYVHSDASNVLSADPGTVQYQFLHDRVQEAAYSLTPEAECKQLHLRVGQLLLEGTPEEQREAVLFEIVNQFNLALDLIKDPEERSKLAHLNLTVGLRAKASGAYSSSARYLEAAVALLPPEAWERDYPLTFSLHRHLAECLYLLSRFDEAEAAFDRVLEKARTRVEKADLYSLKLSLYMSRGRYVDAANAGRTGLLLYSIELPPDGELKSAIEAERSALQARLAGRAIQGLVDLPVTQDPDEQVRARLLSQTVLYVAYVMPELFQLLSAMMLNRALVHGNAPGSAGGYITYSMLLCGPTGDFPLAYDLSQAGLAVSERLDPLDRRSLCQFFYATFVNPWRKHVRTSLPYLDRAYAGCLESGVLSYAGMAALQMTWLGFFRGDELRAHLHHTQKLLDFQRQVNHYDMVLCIGLCQRAMKLLADGKISSQDSKWYQESFIEQSLTHYQAPLASHYIYTLQVAYLLGDVERARQAVTKAAERIHFLFGYLHQVEFYFYEALLAATQAMGGAEQERTLHIKTLETNREMLRRWAESCPENFRHKYLLVCAESAHLDGNDMEALEQYDQSIESAAVNEFIQDQALANELAARFLLSRKRTKAAEPYLRDARYCYQRWGADAKVADLDRRYGPALATQAEVGGKSLTVASLDLITVFKASQAISGEIVLRDLLRKLMGIILENAGAQRGVLLLRDEGGLVVEAQDTGRGVEVTLQEAVPGVPASYSAGIVLYVERTHSTVVLGDARTADQFRTDEYIARCGPLSVLCMPVLKQRKLVGILYLENNLVTNAFTPERRKVLDLLASQAAISLENARLYETLDQRVRDATSELRQSNEELSGTLERLKQMQAQLVMQEKLASLGTLASGIAHELKNPLNFVSNFSDMSVSLTEELAARLREINDRYKSEAITELSSGLGDLRQYAEKIYEHAQRADNIITSMLNHSRSGGGERQETQLDSLMDRYLNLVHRSYQSHTPALAVEVERDYPSSLTPVHVSPQEIGRVFLNLLGNAYYAVEAQRKRRGESYIPRIRLTMRDLGSYVEARIWDNGVGIPAEFQQKIFEPFFTTKPPGEGTGLGLSISYDIVVQGHGGRISVQSQVGEFTEFLVSLPKAQ